MSSDAHSAVLITLKALAHEIRFEIVCLLSQREYCVCELEAILALNQSKISYHLGLLRAAELIVARQQGKNTFYALHWPTLYMLGGELLTQIQQRAERIPTHPINLMC